MLLAIPGTRDDEQELHRKFGAYRAGRERFSWCDAIIEFVSIHQMAAPADEDQVE